MLRQEAAILSKTWRKIQIGRLGFSKEGQKWWFVDGGLLVLLFFFPLKFAMSRGRHQNIK